MPIIKDCLGREVVVYNHSESFDAFCSAIRKAVCKAYDIPEDLIFKWGKPEVFGVINPVKNKENVDILVSDDQEIIYKFTEDKNANSNGACHEHCDLYYFLDCTDIKTKDGVAADEICKGGGYFKEV